MEGIIVINALNNKLVIKQTLNQYINTLDVTQDGNYVFTSLNSSLTIISFESRTQLQIIGSSKFPTNITDIVVDNNELRVYAVGLGGIIVAYDIQNKRNIQQVGIFNTQSVTAHSAFVSPDDNWLLVANDQKGLFIFKIIINYQQTHSNNQQQNEYQLNFNLKAYGLTDWKAVDVVITDSMDYIYCVDNWYGIYIYKFSNLVNSVSSKNPQQIQFNRVWPFSKINPSTYCLILLQSSTYLAVGVRSQGVFIFDIQNKMNPVIYQQISVQQNSFSIAVSKDENYLYYSNANTLFVFEKVKPNLNLNFPNLFNVQQSIFIQTSSSYYKWRCYCKEIDGQNYFFGAFDQDGLFIYNITDPYNFKAIFQNKFQNSLIDSIAFASNLKYMMLPVQENNTSIVAYDISFLDNPQEAFRLKMDDLNHDEAIFISQDEKLIALSFDDGVLLIKYDSELQLLHYWKKFGYMLGENAGVMITNDNKFLIGCVRGYGYYVLSINLQNEQNILVWEYTLQTFGGEGIIPSSYYDNYAYIYDGFRGVGVIDTTTLPKLKVINRVQLQGWSNLIVPILKDDFLLVAQIESGMVSLIDSRNKTNMILISELQYQSQTAQSLCTTEDFQYLFVNNNLGTLVMPLQSQIVIHTQFQQITTDKNGVNTYQQLSDNSFYIGQQIQMRFLILFPKEGTQIIGFQYYQNELIYDSPPWISFDIISQQITLTLDKQALGEQHQNKNVNIILLKLAVPIIKSSFVFDLDDGQSTSLEDSSTIFNTLKQYLNGILLSERLQRAIRLQLQKSIYINQIQFFVSSSLVVDLENSVQPIKSLSQQLQMLFSVDPGQGKFILNNYEGVIASFSSTQEQLQVQGSLISINKLLLSKIIFFSKQDINDIDVSIQIQDSLNYPITQVMKAVKCKALKQKYRISNNQLESLQSQFNKKYSDGIINISELFQIDFSSDTFIDKDSTSINYNGFIVREGDEKNQIQLSTWIQFKVNNGQISIQGTPGTYLLYSKIRIKIIADDGYTQTSDEFIIKIYGISFTIVISMLIQILGPLVAIMKIYTYRYQILNLFYKNKVTFSKETIKCGEIYNKRFIIMGDNMIKCVHLFKGFIVQYNKITKSSQLPNKNSSNLSACCESLEFSIKKLNKINEEEEESNSKIQQPQQQDFSQNQLKQDKLLQQILRIMSQEKNKIKQPYRMQSQQQVENQKLDSKFIDAIDGNIKVKNIIAYIKQSKPQFSISGKSYSISSFDLDFKNQNSFIYKGIEALSARFFLKKDKLSYLIYQHLKRQSLRSSQYNLNDWYKQYVSIQYFENIKDCFGQQIPFPTLSLKTKAIDQVFQQIQQSLNTYASRQYGINFCLIQQVLFADTFGFVGFIPKKLSPCIGESIHLHSYQIHGVQTYQEITHGRCLSLKKILKINYNQYGASKNRSLPNWLEMEHKNNSIDLIGMPMSQDVEDIQIRVTDANNFVINQFTLSIIQSDSMLQSKYTNELNTTLDKQDVLNVSKLEQLESITRHYSRSLTKKLTKLEQISQLRSQQNNQQLIDKVINQENTKQTSDEVNQVAYDSVNNNNNMQIIRETKKSIFCFDKSMKQKSYDFQDLTMFSSPRQSLKLLHKNDQNSTIDKFSTIPTQFSPTNYKQGQIRQLKKLEKENTSQSSLEDQDIKFSSEDFNQNNIFKQDYFTPNKNLKDSNNNESHNLHNGQKN
ncbi:hypothetical protein ABPG72_016034 [Tetrahymena utriculariae]